jgi:hypothetical protein
MPRAQHYSPAIKRFLVSALYHEARGRGVKMTTLANGLLEQALVGTGGWQKAKAQESMVLQETPVEYRTK